MSQKYSLFTNIGMEQNAYLCRRVFRTNNYKHHKAYDEKSTIYDVFNDIAAWRTC